MSPEARAVFRLPWVALAIPVLLLIVTIPLATAARPLNVLFLLPIGALVYVMRARTVVDGQYLTAYGLFTRRRLLWAELDGLEFRGTRWAVAVTRSGARFRLPMIRPRDLPRLVSVSGGRLLLDPPPAPGAENAQSPEPPAPTPPAPAAASTSDEAE